LHNEKTPKIMTLIIKGKGLTIEDVVEVARHHRKVELHEDAKARINKCRAMLEEKIQANEINVWRKYRHWRIL
jgi:histidine ammonia-lyase